jgi:hypothetical protein
MTSDTLTTTNPPDSIRRREEGLIGRRSVCRSCGSFLSLASTLCLAVFKVADPVVQHKDHVLELADTIERSQGQHRCSQL